MKKYIISVLVSALFFSCSDFLDRASLSELADSNFWNSEADAQKALVGCYDALQQEGSFGFCWPGGNTCSLRELDFATDNGYFAWIPWVGPDVITNNTLSPTSAVVEAVWDASYAGIARCNNVIEKVPQMIADGKIGEETGNTFVCEAKFIRAMFYNHLVSLYRDVPLVFNVLTTETSQVPKSSKEEIVTAIIQDLKDITEEGMLPVTADRGRATRGAALGLLTRVYLYNEMWQEAADAAKRIMDLGQYEIDPNYSSLFTEAGCGSNEIVFAIRFVNTDQSNGEGGFLAYNYGYPMEWQLPYPNLANDYYCTDGLPISASPLYNPDDDATRDPRLTYTLFTKNGDSYDGNVGTAWWTWNSPFQLFMRKYQNQRTTYTADNQDMYVTRYADVLLMRAEALAMLQTGREEIMSLVNQVRQRADVMMPCVEDAEGSNLSYEELLDVVKHERRVELAFEGTRYFDLLRWHEMEDAYARCREDGGAGSHIFDSSKGYVWPIPQAELDNNRALVQAPEWGGR